MNFDYTLYLVTDRQLMSCDSLTEAVEQAILGGCTMIQLREKELSSLEFYNQAVAVKQVTDKYHIPLAKDLKISVLTVTKAYTELEQEGFVKNVQGRGCFVMGSGSELIKEQLICKVENNLTEAIKAARMANLSTEELHRLLDILTEVKTDD